MHNNTKEVIVISDEEFKKWQSEPTTEEQWDDMASEIRQMTERVFENETYNTTKEVIVISDEEFKKWQSEPTTKKQWDDMISEIRQMTEKESEKRGDSY